MRIRDFVFYIVIFVGILIPFGLVAHTAFSDLATNFAVVDPANGVMYRNLANLASVVVVVHMVVSFIFIVNAGTEEHNET